MVRKWSYLNKNTPNTQEDKLNLFMERHKFKVFRATTRFKKFNVGTTKIVRKLYSRQKRRTNLITLAFITSDWLNFFFRSRHFYRFLQSYGAFALNVNSADTVVLSKRISGVLSQGGVNSYACTSGTLAAIISNRYPVDLGVGFNSSASRHFLWSRTGFSGNAGLMTQETKNYEVLTNLGPNAAVFDRLTYPYDLNMTCGNDVSVLDNTIFQVSLMRAVCIRQILIHVTLLNVRS